MKVTESLKLHKRAMKVIPGGAQTLSKFYGRYVQGVAPAFIDFGVGAHVFDIDGNEYIDWTGALGPIVLGYYNQEDEFGQTSLPLPNKLEVELAEKLVDIIPHAEMVRFFKTGSGACSAAIRLSRAIKNRVTVVCCGFHGSDDWYASTLPKPRSNGARHEYGVFKVEYGDLTTLEYLFKDHTPACFILEPMNRQVPHLASREYLQKVRELCDKYNVILVFDEMIMGFRYHMAGGEGLYGVTPDLACYGKAIANGFPLAALVGKRVLMEEVAKLQISGTYYGEVLSIAAALDTIEFMEEHNVVKELWKKAKWMNPAIRKMMHEKGLDNHGDGVVYLKGQGPWSAFEWRKEFFNEQCLFLQEIVKRGILYSRDHFYMYAHTDEDIQKTLDVYNESFDIVRKAMDEGNAKDKIEGTIQEDLFPR